MHAVDSRPINQFLVTHGLRIRDNPAISPDLTLDFSTLLAVLVGETGLLSALPDGQAAAARANRVLLHSRSEFSLGGDPVFVVETKDTGDHALLVSCTRELPFADVERVGSLRAVALSWKNLIALKNALLAEDPGCTIFPRAEGSLGRASLGIGARFTTLHWPAVAWVMRHLALPLTANQNSIPRELVFDPNAILEGTLCQVPFPFIGSSVPEGHQGQSVQGMSHAAIIEYLKLGLHRHRIAWGFNADHQPIGGRFDAIETELVEGSLFASYITYDLSPELSSSPPIADPQTLKDAFSATVDPAVHQVVRGRLAQLGIDLPDLELMRLVTYLWPAMQKMVRRDRLYTEIRCREFPSPIGQAFHKELSVDELPGETVPQTMGVCLALAEALGVTFNYVAPNLGFQKNFPYPDSTELRGKVRRLFQIAQKFGASLGFHSGSGKSTENYRVCGEVTGGRLEIKTSGRYTYEMGRALAASPDATDQELWRDWYVFTRRLAIEGAFAENETHRRFAREFVTRSLETAGQRADGVFDSPERLEKTLASLEPTPDHMFWFEYNFLFVLAADGQTSRLGDHTPDGYRQRARFYRISQQGKVLYAKNVARYLLFLAETTGLCPPTRIADARQRLERYESYPELLAGID